MRFSPALIGSAICLSLLLGHARAATTPTLSPAGEGRRMFLKLNCYGCHGMAGGGGMGPNIVGAESGDVNEAVTQGEDTGMPSFSAYFTSTDTANIAAYLRSIGTKTEPTFTHWWEAIPTQ